jgi:hypothetical protein
VGELTAGTITGVTIRTAASGQRVELTSSGLDAIDSGGDTRVEIPTTADRINFYDGSGVLRGKVQGLDVAGNVLSIEGEDAVTSFVDNGTDLAEFTASLGTVAATMQAVDGGENASVSCAGIDSSISMYCDSNLIFKLEEAGATQKMGFFGVTTVARPDITGSRGGNAALADLLTSLASLGLITDSST